MVYYITDFFDVEYCVLRIPEAEREQGDYLIVGPYRDKILTEGKLVKQMKAKNIPKDFAGEMKEYYKVVPIVPSIEEWRNFWSVICQALNNSQEVRTEHIIQTMPGSNFLLESAENINSMEMTEAECADENRFLKAVSCGNEEEAIGIFNDWKKYKKRTEFKMPVREIQNDIIVLNTLLRKAAEVGGVHPYYLKSFSEDVMKQTEMVDSLLKQERMKIQMIRKYCLLVRNSSVQGYTLVIQRAVNYINLNLEKDLSLKHLGEVCSVNPSYLSALFKKEMKINITEYISRQRIHLAVNLLDSKNMQIQDVAAACGIYDVNYFRKVFKKQMGITPKEYQCQIKKIN